MLLLPTAVKLNKKDFASFLPTYKYSLYFLNQTIDLVISLQGHFMKKVCFIHSYLKRQIRNEGLIFLFPLGQVKTIIGITLNSSVASLC